MLRGRKVLFFSRGRGRGHAIPDMAIAGSLRNLTSDYDLQFISYGTGAETFRQEGVPVLDLGFADSNPSFLAMLIAAQSSITALDPIAVIAHEEFAVLPAAHLCGVPAIFVTDWFPFGQSSMTESMGFADAVIFIGDPNIFPIPNSVRCPTRYVGPVVRAKKYTLSDRDRARRELDVPEDALLISVVPGSWATEQRSPIVDLIHGAFELLPPKRRILFWLSRSDVSIVNGRFVGSPDIRAMANCPCVEQVIVASDVVITKGNRGTILDAASLGVPSISISHGHNPVDDLVVRRIPSNTALEYRFVSAEILAFHVMKIASHGLTACPPLNYHEDGGQRAANALHSELDRVSRLPAAQEPAQIEEGQLQ